MSDPKQRDWDEKLAKAERDINNAVNKTSGKTPFEMLYGYQPEFHSTTLRRIVGSDEAQWENPEELRTRVRQRIIAEQEKSKAAYDRRHFPARLYDVGDIVFMTKAPEQTGKPTKAQLQAQPTFQRVLCVHSQRIATKILGRVLPSAPVAALDLTLCARDPQVVAYKRNDPLRYHGTIPLGWVASLYRAQDIELEASLDSGRLTDVEFKVRTDMFPNVGESNFRAHKLFLALRSEAFDAMFFEDLAEQGIVDVTDIHPDSYDIML
ncbi:hypothetical protein V5799_007119, partial [Amblyomma americanum]